MKEKPYQTCIMLLDTQLPDAVAADSKSGQSHFEDNLSEHRISSMTVLPHLTPDHIMRFADDMTVVCLVTKNDESAYRKEVEKLALWCWAHNLHLSVD